MVVLNFKGVRLLITFIASTFLYLIIGYTLTLVKMVTTREIVYPSMFGREIWDDAQKNSMDWVPWWWSSLYQPEKKETSFIHFSILRDPNLFWFLNPTNNYAFRMKWEKVFKYDKRSIYLVANLYTRVATIYLVSLITVLKIMCFLILNLNECVDH